MKDAKLVWSDTEGDLRKKKGQDKNGLEPVEEKDLILNLRRLTSGKGRTIIEVSGLPNNKKWCQKLAKEIKKSLGVGGAFKNSIIEVYGEQLDKVVEIFEQKGLRWKKIGG